MHRAPHFPLPCLIAAAAFSPVAHAVDYVWTDGDFVVGVTAPSPLVPPDTLAIDAGTVAKRFVSVNFANQSSVAWNAGDVGFVTSNVSNDGLWDAKGDLSFYYAGGNPSSFVNNSTFRKSGGSGVTQIGNNVDFANNGVIEVMVGTLQLPNNFINPGTITGGGVVQTTSLTNNGHVAPGNGVGGLTLDGSFLQGALGILDIELGALGSHDLLTVTGTTSLNGTLALSCDGDCRFAPGDTITILDSAGTLTGAFAGVSLAGFGTGKFDVFYNAPLGEVSLKVLEDVTPVPEPETWAMLLAGLGLLGPAMRRRRGPGIG